MHTHPRLERNRTPIAIALAVVVLAIAGTTIVRERMRSARRENEARLGATLGTIREAIRSYRAKHGEPPPSLVDLIRDGELREVPPDPITGSASTWMTTVEESVRVDDFQSTPRQPASRGIIDVRSGAAGTDSNGRPWSDY